MVRGIVLVVVDCLRADHVSGYGYARETVARLTGDLHRWWRGLQADASKEPGGEVQVDEQVVQRLRALGYIE